jgi:hypothetical protein
MLLAAVGLVGVAVFGGTVLIVYLARPESVVRLTTQAVVAANNSAKVTETIDYRFNGFTKHGIYRDIHGLSAYYGISASVDGRPAQLDESADDSGGTSVRIGDPHHWISGDHTYTVRYPLSTFLTVLWDGLSDWTVPVDHAELDVTAPWTWTNLNCHDDAGTTATCTVAQPLPGLLTVHVDHMGAQQALTVEADRGPALTTVPPLPARPSVRWPPLGPSPYATAAAAAAAVILAGLGGVLLFERRGSRRAEAGMVTASASGVRRVDAYQLDGNRDLQRPKSTPPAACDGSARTWHAAPNVTQPEITPPAPVVEPPAVEESAGSGPSGRGRWEVCVRCGNKTWWRGEGERVMCLRCRAHIT